MTPEQFAYWLQGFFELEHGTVFTKREQIIKDHLKEVFHKKTPNYNALPNTAIQQVQCCPCRNSLGINIQGSCGCYCHTAFQQRQVIC